MQSLSTKLRELTEVLMALIALVEAFHFGDVVDWLDRHLPGLHRASILVIASLPLTLALAVLLLALARMTASRRARLIRPEAFDLRIREPADLQGRSQDVQDLCALFDEHRLVFVDGESGAGKSALVCAGLVPELSRRGQLLPILVTRYGDGWERGPLRATVAALRESLGDEERAQLDLVKPLLPEAVTVERLRELLAMVRDRLGRTPLLIFDQFDDYQLQHKARFLSDRRAWITAAELEASNSYWALLGVMLREETAYALFVTRADTAAGLRSVSFVRDLAVRTVDRLQGIYLAPLLDQLAPAGADPRVVVHPENGWDDLKRRLAGDLQHDGVVLPQQVRTVVLGLRHLPYLTPSAYRRAGEAAGVEALLVREAITYAARVSREAGEADVRELLLAMVERGQGPEEAKTRPCTDEELRAHTHDDETRKKILEALRNRELVRMVCNPESGADEWMLDHDYLARAVVAEERWSDRHTVQLRDAGERWRRATGLWPRYRTLLPLREQLALLLGRLRRKVHYGPWASYARWSLLRAIPPLVLTTALAATVYGGWDELRRRELARRIVDALRLADATADAAVVELWSSPPDLRGRVTAEILANDAALQSAKVAWVSAVAGLDPRAVRALASELTDRLGRAPRESTALRRKHVELLNQLAPRMTQLDALALARVYRERLGDESAPTVRKELLRGLTLVAPRLPADEAERTGGELARMLRGTLVAFERERGLLAIEALAPRIEERAASELLALVLDWHAEASRSGSPPVLLVSQAYARALAALAARTAEPDIGRLLQVHLSVCQRNSTRLTELVPLASRLRGEHASRAFARLLDDVVCRYRCDCKPLFAVLAPNLPSADADRLAEGARLRGLEQRLGRPAWLRVLQVSQSQQAAREVEGLVERALTFDQGDESPQASSLSTLCVLALQKGVRTPEWLAQRLMRRMAGGDRTRSHEAVRALEAIAPELPEVTASALSARLLERFDGASEAYERGVLIDVLEKLAASGEAATERLVEALGARVHGEPSTHVRSVAYETLGALAHTPLFAERVMRDLMEHVADDPEVRPGLLRGLIHLADHLSPASAARASSLYRKPAGEPTDGPPDPCALKLVARVLRKLDEKALVRLVRDLSTQLMEPRLAKAREGTSTLLSLAAERLYAFPGRKQEALEVLLRASSDPLRSPPTKLDSPGVCEWTPGESDPLTVLERVAGRSFQRDLSEAAAWLSNTHGKLSKNEAPSPPEELRLGGRGTPIDDDRQPPGPEMLSALDGLRSRFVGEPRTRPPR